MKILILSMTCGEAHNTIARSISEYLKKYDCETKIVDIYESNLRLLNFNNKGYLFMCKYLPNLYSIGWNFMRHRNPEKRFKGSGYKSIKSVLDYNLQIINEYAPDAIICTHNTASSIISTLKHQERLKDIPTYTFVTDYVLCPFWEDSIKVDTVFTPNQIMHDELIKKGFSENQIVCTGFPTNLKFYKPIDKHKARKLLKINQHKFTVLIINGGAGLGNTLKLVKNALKSNYKDNIQILVICGRNATMKKRIDDYITKNAIYNVFNFGFVNNVNEFMSASDVVFSRAGCGSLSEALNLGLVPIIRERTQANETINKRLFVEKNLAFGMKRIGDAPKILNQIKANPNLLLEKQKNIKKFNVNNGLINSINYIIEKINKQ